MRDQRLIEPLDPAKKRDQRMIAGLVANKVANHPVIALLCFVQIRNQPVIGRLEHPRRGDQRMIAGLVTGISGHHRLPGTVDEGKPSHRQAGSRRRASEERTSTTSPKFCPGLAGRESSKAQALEGPNIDSPGLALRSPSDVA